jgi:hypothetical protein
MAGKIVAASGAIVGNLLGKPKMAKAYTEGRAAKIAGKLASANPHAATSTDGVAWLAGFNQHVVAGTLRAVDMSADRLKT